MLLLPVPFFYFQAVHLWGHSGNTAAISLQRFKQHDMKNVWNSWWVFALLSAFFAALTSIFAKIGMKQVNADLATAVRTVVILLLAWGIVAYKGGTNTLHTLTLQNWVFLLLSGMATGLSWIFYFRALQAGKVSQVAPIDKSSLALTILLSVIFLGETLTWKTAFGALLILAGTFVLIL